MSPAEVNYKIYDKELLAIIKAFEQQRPKLEGHLEPIKVITDYRNLVYYTTSKMLSRRQARQSEFLSRFDFEITYRPGAQGTKPDSLIRRSANLPILSNSSDPRTAAQYCVILKPYNFDLSSGAPTCLRTYIIRLVTNPTPIKDTIDLEQLRIAIQASSKKDRLVREIAGYLQNGIVPINSKNSATTLSPSECRIENDMLYYRDCLYVPSELLTLYTQILRINYDLLSAGHPGRNYTFDLVTRNYYQLLIREDIERFVAYYYICIRTKSSRQSKASLLRPLSVLT